MKKFSLGFAAVSVLIAGAALPEPVSIEGTLVAVSKDDFNRGQAQIVYLLQTATTTFQLEFSGAAPDEINKNAVNRKVRVSGERSGGTIKVANAAAIVRLAQ